MYRIRVKLEKGRPFTLSGIRTQRQVDAIIEVLQYSTNVDWIEISLIPKSYRTHEKIGKEKWIKVPA